VLAHFIITIASPANVFIPEIPANLSRHIKYWYCGPRGMPKRPAGPINIISDAGIPAHHANLSNSKHMDKHERPYKCDKPQCAKLLGFTYSGGLLRHEREVHSMHGGPKEQLFCPIKHCKRHTEQGFTRRENLQEHLRRVHKLQDVDSIEAAAHDALTPGTAPSDHDSDEDSQSIKRKRMSVVSQGEDAPEEDIKTQLKKLRLDNAELRNMGENQRAELDAMKEQIKFLQEQLAGTQHVQIPRWRPNGAG
jgi:hypothetical protein